MLWMFEGFTDYMAHVIMLRAGVTAERDFLRMIAETGRSTRRGRGATRRRWTSCRSRRGSSNTNRPRASSTARSATTRRGCGRRWRWTSRCGWRPAGGAACPRCSAGCGTATGAGRARSPRPTCATRRRRRGAAVRRLLRELRPRHARAAAAGAVAARRAGGDGARGVGRERSPGADRDGVRARRTRAWTGIALRPERTLIRNVVPDSPAWRAGLTFGDDIVAVAGARVTAATFDKRVGDHDPGARVRIAFFRRDVLQEAVRRWPRAPTASWSSLLIASASAARARGARPVARRARP